MSVRGFFPSCDKQHGIKMAALISAFAFTSVCVSARLLSAGQKVCEKWGRGVIIFFTPQTGMCLLLVAFFFPNQKFLQLLVR